VSVGVGSGLQSPSRMSAGLSQDASGPTIRLNLSLSCLSISVVDVFRQVCVCRTCLHFSARL
jgi:hypothetical protein